MKNEEKIRITREKLLTAAEKLIEQYDDPFKVTSRQIAAESGMQAAMINYCFGSRENLIYQVFQNKYEKTLKDADVLKIINSDKYSPKEKLKKLHFIISGFLLNDFKFTKAVTAFVLFNRDLTKEAFSLKYVTEHYAGRKSPEECWLIAYELSAMMQLIVYRCDDIKEGMGIDLHNEKELKHYIDMRVDLLLQDQL